MNIALNIIILGPQGSGKGTQAELLARKYNLVFLGAGHLLREIARTGTRLGQEVHESINVRGEFVKPEVISEVFRLKLGEIPAEQGVIMESYPRNLTQYNQMKAFWPALRRGGYKVLYIELSDEDAVKRISTRITCENCGAIYIAGKANKCTKCGGELVQRIDDRPETVKKRLELFQQETFPMVKQMEQEGKVVYLSGAGSVEQVNAEILDKLKLA